MIWDAAVYGISMHSRNIEQIDKVVVLEHENPLLLAKCQVEKKNHDITTDRCPRNSPTQIALYVRFQRKKNIAAVIAQVFLHQILREVKDAAILLSVLKYNTSIGNTRSLKGF